MSKQEEEQIGDRDREIKNEIVTARKKNNKMSKSSLANSIA